MTRRFAVLLVFLVFAVIGTGCGFKDIDKRFFVLAIGVDDSGKEEAKYRVTLKLAIPAPKIVPGETNRSQLVSEDASTVAEAVRLIKSKVDKELDFGHAKVILFGKKIASEDVRIPLDWFLRRRDIQQIAYVAVGDPSAAQVLSASPPSERLPANSLILSFDQEGTESAYVATMQLSEFYRRMKEHGKDPYLPVIHLLKESFVINRVAVFDKIKMKAILNPDETRVFNELATRRNKFEIHAHEDGINVNIAVSSFNVKYKIEDEPSPVVRVRAKIEGIVEESNQRLYEMDWSHITDLFSKQIEERAVQLMQKLQKLKVDPIGLGIRYQAARWNKHEDWERWQDLYPSIDFDVKVQTKLFGTGGIK